jgi:hypothetical protein
MATMLPPDIQSFTTPGEGAFYRFLQGAARPDERNTAWYLPDIQGREPDFILFSEDLGLVVFEVKDWVLDQILRADPQHFVLDVGGTHDPRQNPLRQAREYFNRIMSLIREDARLLSRDPHHLGNVKIPVTCAVVFPNINKHEYHGRGLEAVIPAERVFFWDDLHPQSPICEDPSGHCFREAVAGMFEHRFDFRITPRELDHLRQLIFPTVRIDLPDRRSLEKRAAEEKRLMLLDRHQESIARQFGGGHRIVAGPSGSGKTLVLVHRAALLRQYNPAVKNVLFVCYNVTLVNYIRRLLADKRVPLGEGGVEVLHFYELCARITGMEIPYEKEDSEFYDLVIEETLRKLPACPLRYDAVLVDEGQDFSDDMMRIVVSVLNPETNNLMIALDSGQNIYQRRRSWEKVGVQARGRVQPLRWVYRNTREIADCARAMLGEERAAGEGGPAQTALPLETFEAEHGPPPEILQFGDVGEIASFVAGKIADLNAKEGYPLSEIAVLYTMRTPPHLPGVNVPRLLARELDRRGILHSWVSEDYRAKRSYDVTTDRVTVSTVHSAKGFDWACVFVVGLDWLENGGRWSPGQARRLAYVAASRARRRLFILHEEPLAA